MKITKKNKIIPEGYAILELLFYIAFFSVLSLIVINAMISMARSFRETSIQREFAQSGVIMERISREIRQAYDINLISTNNLKLNTKDESGNNKTVEFSLSGSSVNLLENDILIGVLNDSDIIVTNLTFTQITTAEGKAVKVFLTIQSKSDILNRTQDFYDTIVLRGMY